MLPAASYAACTQADLRGIWQAYSAAADSGGADWVRCRLAINPSGTIANTSCTSSTGFTGPLTNGRASITSGPNCTFAAQFTFGGVVNRVVHGTLARNKITGTGVGTFPGGAFLFSLTKI
jgi:hypothetical protein